MKNLIAISKKRLNLLHFGRNTQINNINDS